MANPILPATGTTVIGISPPAPKAPVGKLQHIPNAEARLKYLPEEGKGGYRIVTLFRGTSRTVDIEKDEYKGLDVKQIDEVWKRVKSYLGEGVRGIRIDFGNLTLRYTDSKDQVQYIDLSIADPSKPIDKKLVELIKNVRKSAKKIWVDLKFAYQFDQEAIRGAKEGTPFIIPIERWKQMMPKNPSQFLTAGHFEDLRRMVKSDEAAQKALRNILAAEAFIQKLQEEAKRNKEELAAQIQNPDFHLRPFPTQTQIKNSARELELFEKQLEELDRFPIYWAAGVWGDLKKGAPPEERFAKAKLISEGIESTLSKKFKPGEDPRDNPFFGFFKTAYFGQMKKMVGWGEPQAEKILGAGPFIAAYAAEAGDLAAESKLELIRRTEEDGNRESSPPSLIDFMAHSILYLQDAEFNVRSAFDALKLKFDPETVEILVKGVETARGEGRGLHEGIEQIQFPLSSSNPRETVDFLNRSPVLQKLVKR